MPDITEVIEKVTINEVVEKVTINEVIEKVTIVEGGNYSFNVTTIEPEREVLTISFDNQTVFELLNIPTKPSKATVFLNGVKQTYAVHFIINNVIFTWLSSVRLSVSDILEIYYL